MPRTKYNKKQVKTSVENNPTFIPHSDSFTADCKAKRAQYLELFENSKLELDMKMKNINIIYKNALNKTLGELSATEHIAIVKSINSFNDDGYLSTTESSIDSNLTKSRVKFTPAAINHSAFKTPATGYLTKHQAMTMGYVTPKVKPDRPVTVLRRAQAGEMVISMSGSPILANAMESERANVNVPLGDGRIISVQPQSTIRQSEIPEIDEATSLQLQALRDNIDRIVAKNKRKD